MTIERDRDPSVARTLKVIFSAAGLLLLTLKTGAGVRWRAAVTGIGVVLGVNTMLPRLRADGREPVAGATSANNPCS